VNGELSFLAWCFTVLVQRISNFDEIQNNSVTPDNVGLLNVIIYGSLCASELW